jgi:hypothetical protein
LLSNAIQLFLPLMRTVTLFSCLSLVSSSVAQSTSLGIEAIEAHFSQSRIVPDLFSSFIPSALLTLNYAGVGDVNPGQLLTKEQVAPTPTVNITPANSSLSLNGNYTLAMVDADIVGSKYPNGETRHWLVNGVSISGSMVINASATAITRYAGPAPAAGSGPHRYVVVLYAQPSTFKPPAAFSQPNIGVSTFDFNSYVKNSGLGDLIAGTYFTVEEGTATASISPTSAVISATLLSSSDSKSAGTSPAAPIHTSAVKYIEPQFSIITALLIVAFLNFLY